jgi:hypothetical protein
MILLSLKSFAADNYDYYVVDTITYANVKLVDYGLRENCLHCSELVNDTLKKFTPDQVKEYGIGGKQFYVAMDVKLYYGIKRVFLLKNKVGTYTLYHHMDERHEVFFLQSKDGPLVELVEHGNLSMNFRQQLSDLCKDNPTLAKASTQVEYTMKSIVPFLEKCQEIKTKLVTRLGVAFGTDISRLSPPTAYFNLTLPVTNDPFKAAPTVGCFVEQELVRSSLFVHAACNATWTTASYNQLNGNLDNDFIANLHTLEVPIHLKYLSTEHRIHPFVEVGGVFLWNFYNDHFVQQSRMNGQVIDMLGRKSQGLVDDFLIGPSLAVGLEIPWTRTISLFTECRVDKSYGVTLNHSCELTKIALTTGFIF